MSQPDRVSFTLSEAEAATVASAIAALQGVLLPRLINLSAEARHELPKMGDKTYVFVQKSLEHCRRSAELVPNYVSIPAFETDVAAVETLRSIHQPLLQLVESIDDTMMLSGSEAYTAALMFYKSTGTAAKADVAAAKVVHDDLAVRFNARATAVPATAEAAPAGRISS